MTELPDDARAALATEPTFMARPLSDAEMEAERGAYLRPAEPVSPAEFSAMVEKAVRVMWDYPLRPSEPVPWRCVVHPGEWVDARGCPSCCRIGRQRADSRAWVTEVRERLQSAVYAASNGYGWTWTVPGRFGVPGLPESVQIRDVTPHWRPTNEEPDD